MATLTIREEKDLDRAKALWQTFSPNEFIWDSWDFRYLFYHTYDVPGDILFLVGTVDGQDIGLLPLQFTPETKVVEFFGGDYMEDNRIFLKPGFETHAKAFFDYAAGLGHPLSLVAMRGSDPYTASLPLHDYKYAADVAGMKSYEDFTQKNFSSSSRAAFRKKIRKIEAANLQVAPGTPADIERLMELNIASFGTDSSFTWPRRQRAFRELAATTQFSTHFLTFSIEKTIIAVSLALHYGSIYSFLCTGADRDAVPNLHMYTTFHNLQRAMDLGAASCDALLGSYGWKDKWHFVPTPQYEYKAPAA